MIDTQAYGSVKRSRVDIIADIVNVLLFKNKRLIKEDESTAESPRPQKTYAMCMSFSS